MNPGQVAGMTKSGCAAPIKSCPMTEKTEFHKVAVLAGGVGSERSVSLLSGRTIYETLKQTNLEVLMADITPTDLSILDRTDIDMFFLALHGEFGEDGRLQRILEERGLVFTGSDSRASELAFDKSKAKYRLSEAGVPTAPALYLDTLCPTFDPERLQAMGARFVVKPLRQGSSVGVRMIEGADGVEQAARDCLRQYGDCMIERFVAGREITVGIVDGEPLPIIEIRPKTAFYDFHAKYEDDGTEYLFNTVDSPELVKAIQQAALDSHNALGCRHLSRVDFILSDDGRFVALEVNTLPGFTSHSLLPMAAKRAGMPIDRLCLRILRSAWRDRRRD